MMKKTQAFVVVVLALTCSQVFGDSEPNARDELNVNAREVVPLDQIQTKPWRSPENYPQFATNPGPYQPSYFGGYPQGNQMFQPRMMGPQYPQQGFQPQNFQQFYRPQPLPYPIPQQYQQPWQNMPTENFGSFAPNNGFETYGPQDRLPQGESQAVEPNIPQGIPPNPVETPTSSQMWAPQPSSWGAPTGLPTWKRSYTPLPGQSGCFNRCRPSCGPSSCQSSCQSACNIRPTCGRRGPTLFSGSTMICGRQGLVNQGGLWPEVNPWQDYQNSWGQPYPQFGLNANSQGQVPPNNGQAGVEAI